MNKRQIIPYGLLLTAFLLWLYLKPQEQLASLPEHHPSFIAHQLDNTHFDESGAISYTIIAQKSTHFSDKEETLFEDPKIIFYIQNEQGEQPTEWQLSSKKGVMLGTHKITLMDDVWLRNTSLDQFVQSMNTEKLNIFLTKKEISTDLPVQWQGPQMQQQGIGMWASLTREELIVKKQIKAIYLNETK